MMRSWKKAEKEFFKKKLPKENMFDMTPNCNFTPIICRQVIGILKGVE